MGISVDARNLVKTYHPSDRVKITVLDGLSMSLEAGSITAIIGPSGSGKSTLLHILGTLDQPTEGSIELAGTALPVGADTLATFRRDRIGFVFQQHHLVPHLTVLDNVLLPTLAGRGKNNTQDCIERAKSLLSQVGLSERLTHRPSELSGGECQRVAVVRAIIQQPDLVLADEPTGALDSVTASTLLDVLFSLQKAFAFTLILVTHSPEVAARASRTLRMESGRLLEVCP